MLSNARRHIPALFTAIVWGSTFVASKQVLSAGIEEQVLMTFRFVLAYIILWCLCRERRPIRFNRNELKYVLVGISGGSLYFLMEYLALQRTSAVNVGLISSMVPIFSVGMSIMLRKTRFYWQFAVGSVVALTGAFFVITNGDFALQIFPVGDLIAIGSTLLWSIYTLVLSTIDKDMPPLFVSRRLFFYAMLTSIPYVILTTDTEQFVQITTSANTLIPAIYLGAVASALCIYLWHVSVNKIGLTTTNNYLYLLPIVSVITSAIFANEEISVYNAIGSVLIFIGIITADAEPKRLK